MNFRTPITIPKNTNLIDYNSKIVGIGSCFVENMATKLDYFKLDHLINPFGIIFNPISIEKLVFRIVNRAYFDENDLVFHNQLWHCFEVHSRLSSFSKSELLFNLNLMLDRSFVEFKKGTHFMITYGSSWVYRNLECQKIVANCHKIPQNQFSKELLSSQIITSSIQNTIELLRSINPNAQLIFTVSPVRHLKDGFVENNVSKANLLSAVFEITYKKAQNTVYFPSFEIMMDDLRDYRFFDDDMLHPNKFAIQYIWEQLVLSNFSNEAVLMMKEVEDIQKMRLHKIIKIESAESHIFNKKISDKIKQIQTQFPQIIF